MQSVTIFKCFIGPAIEIYENENIQGVSASILRIE